MIDYEKLKLAHELAEKFGSEIAYAYNNKEGIFFCWLTLDQLLLEMQGLTNPKPKYRVGQLVWRVDDEDQPHSFVIMELVLDADQMYSDGESWWVEEQLYPTREALIDAQIEYWSCLKNQEFQHESDGLCYTSNPPKNKCNKCGEFYK